MKVEDDVVILMSCGGFHQSHLILNHNLSSVLFPDEEFLKDKYSFCRLSASENLFGRNPRTTVNNN